MPSVKTSKATTPQPVENVRGYCPKCEVETAVNRSTNECLKCGTFVAHTE